MNNANERYAIFRTRLQPYTVAHAWAIKNFLHWSSSNDAEKTHGATRLILAIVDPSLKITKAIQGSRPRFLSELNPFNDWMSAMMAHQARCSLSSTGQSGSQCVRVMVTRIPSIALLTKTRNQKGAIDELKRRLPLDNGIGSIWYFPIFDKEDLVDIEKVWHCMKSKAIPKAPVMVSHHSQFEYRLKAHPEHDHRTIGAYAAATFEIVGIEMDKSLGNHPIVSESILKMTHTLFGSDLENRLKICHDELMDSSHPVRTDNLFSFVNSEYVVNFLVEKYKEIFGNDPGSDLSFLPPDPKSLHVKGCLLQKIIRPLREYLSVEEFQKFFGTLLPEIENRLALTEQRACTIREEIVNIVTTRFAKEKVLQKMIPNWENLFNDDETG